MGFHVIALDTGLPVTTANGDAIVYVDGRAAAMQAKEHTERTGKKHQPRPVLDDNWQARELGRMDDGTYTPVPWDVLRVAPFYQETPDNWDFRTNPGYVRREREYARQNCWFYNGKDTEHHYAHVSTKVPGNVAFTETPEKGAANIQTSMKPGRYLQRFYGDRLTEAEIREHANQFIVKYGAVALKFANTADDIERVYVNGPRSCMSSPASAYSSPFHPARVYAAGDLAVAYLSATDDGEEHITARVLCWPTKKIYGRIYGDEGKLAALLDAQGYHNDVLDGAKLTRVEHRDAFVCPYIDNSFAVDDGGDFLIIREGGEIGAEQTDGLSAQMPPRCPQCDSRIDADNDNTYYIRDLNEFVCEDCADNNAFYCEHTDDYWSNDYAVTMHGGEVVSQRWFDRNGFTCEGNGGNYPRDARVTLADGTEWSQDYFEDHGFVCDQTGECYNLDDMVIRANGERVSQEWSNDNPETSDGDECDPMQRMPHVIRQGRDESPNQIEMPLTHQYRAGESVVVSGSNWISPGTYVIERVAHAREVFGNPEYATPDGQCVKCCGYWIEARCFRPASLAVDALEVA